MSRERRTYPRLAAEFPVQVWVPAHDSNAVVHAGTASNISRNSIQFSCDAELVAAVLRQRALPYTCELAFSLPMQQREFRLLAQVVTHRRVSRHLYVLVLLLVHDDKQQDQELDEFITRHLHPDHV